LLSRRRVAQIRTALNGDRLWLAIGPMRVDSSGLGLEHKSWMRTFSKATGVASGSASRRGALSLGNRSKSASQTPTDYHTCSWTSSVSVWRQEGQQKQRHQNQKGWGHREKDPELPEGTREPW
jgi:hypothetical protein